MDPRPDKDWRRWRLEALTTLRDLIKAKAPEDDIWKARKLAESYGDHFYTLDVWAVELAIQKVRASRVHFRGSRSRAVDHSPNPTPQGIPNA